MYQTSTSMPSAYIVSAVDKGRKKIYLNSKIYLENNSEFQIELFNPLQESVLTEIKINGKIASASGLILKPGQRFYLDCSVDDKRKFVFKTYEIENTTESLNATANNGYVEISFFKEKTHYFNNSGCTWIINPNTWTINPNNPYTWPGSFTTCGGTSNINITSNSTLCSSSYTSNTSSIGAMKGMRSKDTTETGRIEKGNSSNQKFESVSMEFETYCINKISYQILPESKKPVETYELKKKINFCFNCGFNIGIININYKFCPSCGTKI